VAEVLASRADFQSALDRIGLPYWPSQANFVLVNIGLRHRDFVRAMHDRGVLVRDRSSDPGCDGWVRITVGTREHTELGLIALEESLATIGWSATHSGEKA
jgi:histidinol-phosphate aminotransferase